MASMIGHNGGPSVQPGEAWRRHCWKAARESLLPTLPIEVVRRRVTRAKELGLDYRTYASVRAASGHDVVAFLFSSNALRVGPLRPVMPNDRAARLAALVEVQRVGLANGRLAPSALLAGNPDLLDRAELAPAHLARWGEARARLREVLGKLPSDGVVLVGDMGLEEDWAMAARLAAYLPAERYFAGAAG
jgi:hypothetical protein